MTFNLDNLYEILPEIFLYVSIGSFVLGAIFGSVRTVYDSKTDPLSFGVSFWDVFWTALIYAVHTWFCVFVILIFISITLPMVITCFSVLLH